MHESMFEDVVSYSAEFLRSLAKRPVAPSAAVDELRGLLGGPLPEQPSDPSATIRDLIAAAEPGLMATAGPRFFGFVIGGSYPQAVAADWLTSVWDQNSGLYAAAPASSVVEEVAGAWLLELLGLPRDASFGLVTGGQMANYTCLAAARHHVLKNAGWDVETKGLQDAPRVRVIAGEERHVTIDRSLRFLGLGTESLFPVACDDQGRLEIDALRSALAEGDGPTIVCAQAGNVNSGAFDPIGEVCDIAHASKAWVHVDGAFGLWAAAVPGLRHLIEGVERADSWATDAHKWLNVPYDSGVAICAHPDSHRAAMQVHASYLVHSEGERERDQMDWNPEFSRRARGFPIYVTLKSLGTSGVIELVERCCEHARTFAKLLAELPRIEILNDVVLNQVLIRFLAEDGDHDTRTKRVIERVQKDGTCWLGGSMWRGMYVMRISVSNWSTTTADVEASVDAITRAAAAV
jgi:glutamate/tyrosine decarboxylase-like PLP-dependent enzyme